MRIYVTGIEDDDVYEIVHNIINERDIKNPCDGCNRGNCKECKDFKQYSDLVCKKIKLNIYQECDRLHAAMMMKKQIEDLQRVFEKTLSEIEESLHCKICLKE